MTAGSQCVAMLEYDAIVTLPTDRPLISAASWRSRCSCCKKSRTAGSICSPQGVRRTPRLSRKSSAKPSSASSAPTSWLTPDGV